MAREGLFGGFYFDPEIFGSYRDEVDPTKTELVLSGAIVNDAELGRIVAGGTNVATIPLYAPLDGDAINYDGENDNTPVTIEGKKQTGMVFGRMKAWKSGDFVKELSTADPMANIGRKVGKYYQKVNQKTLLSILKGIAGVSGISNHIYDISAASGSTPGDANKISPTAVETAKQLALGDNANIARLMIVPSAVYSTMKIQNLVDFAKYTVGGALVDSIDIPTYQGMLLLVDDGMPRETAVATQGVYTLKVDTAFTAGAKINLLGVEYEFVANSASDTGAKIKVGADGTAAQQATNIKNKLDAATEGEATNFTYTVSSDTVTLTAVNTKVVAVPSYSKVSGTGAATVATTTAAVYVSKYTSYILGAGFILSAPAPVERPNYSDYDPETDGGIEKLYTKERLIYHPNGFSLSVGNIAKESPTDAELETSANW